ncbi:MAG: M81 family metallopeptidase [Devosia nanyangense]|uniref:Microcystinase C n=1 Tax=Devosia nanyangense TaxID=1228055 RepID=A0A933P004_9HYPH|nr:M81 family metallopeptidase [Devosia nanyangense]
MRVAVGSLFQETNTFVPFRTDLETFRSVFVRRGSELIDGYAGARIEVPAFLTVLAEAGVEAVPLIAASAISSGAVTRAAFEALIQEMVERLRAAGPVDGVLLALHGAMVIEDNPDAEGEIIDRVAAVIPEGTPIGVSLDLHGHITPRMLHPDTFLVGYREYPHIDMYETGERVAHLLLDTLAGKVRPVMALAKRPMIVSPVAARTGSEPLASVFAEARRMERSGEILFASLFPVQPWLDVPDLGFAVMVCADGNRTTAQAAADKLADLVWDARLQFDPDLVSLEDAVGTGLSEQGTTVVGDAGDAPTGGAAADSAGVLTALLAAGADKAGRLTYLTLCDAEAAQEAAAAGVGAQVTLKVGHKRSPADGQPIQIQGLVRSIHAGDYIMHDKGAEGMVIDQGLTVVLAIGDMRLVLRSRPGFEWDRSIYSAFGLDIQDAALVFVKSPSHFRTGFEPYATRLLIADTPGPTCPNMRRLRFERVTRPLYPIDQFES